MHLILLLSALTVFQVDPCFRKPILPDADPAGAEATETLSFAAARGETEAVSFVVRPDRDLEKVDVVPSDLVGPDGAKIPSAAADVALVKVWFRPGGRWNTSWCGDLKNPEPLNTLVLHDDAFLRVDWEKKVNYLRAEYPDGVTYLDISRRTPATDFSHDCEPVRDAPKFVPFDLKKDFRQQYLVTWKVPKDAKPGDYKGTIALSTLNSQLLTLNLSLTVHPFALPRPRTHYDSREPYVSYWMGSPTLEDLLRGGHRLDRAERKLRAIFRNMAEHNAVNLAGIGKVRADSTDDYAVRTLLIARQEGMCADPLINGLAFDMSHGFVCAGSAGKRMDAEDDPALYAQSLADYRASVSTQVAAMDRHLGHHRCYYTSLDECDKTVNRRSYGYWSIVHELGGGIWTDFAKPADSGVFIDMNDISGHIDHQEAWAWHRGGAKAVTYAATFTGVENPDVWRRNKGLRFWYADYDGQHEYCFFDGRHNRWNDFAARGPYCIFGIVYWTEDGLVPTLAWEAVRESLDDVRYFSLLRLRAEAAVASSDPETRALGRRALAWQDGVDPEYVGDLNAFRRETVGWIERLIAKVGPQPEEPETELRPPAVLPPETRGREIPKASDAAAVFAYADRMAGNGTADRMGEGRYDLALLALDGLLGENAAATADRVKAALLAAKLRAALREREPAVTALKRALALDAVTDADRGRLLLQTVDVLMTDAKYQERRTAEELERAEKVLSEALACAGVAEAERASAVLRLAEGCLSAGAYEKCIAFAEARLADTKLTGPHQAELQFAVARAWRGLKQPEKSLKAFERAHRSANPKDKFFLRRTVETEALVAEEAKDWLRAVDCWSRLVKVCNPVEQKDQVDRARRHLTRLQPLVRKSTRPAAGFSEDCDSGDSISLDE